MLQIEALHCGYGTGTVLEDLTLSAAAGTVHPVVGHNGAGKTTLIHTIAGLIRPIGGSIRLDGRDITTWSTQRRARAGIALVPQGRRIWPSLTVAEHLTTATGKLHLGRQRWTQPQVLALLPQLANRLRHRGAQLSGGEQQMLAIGRALLTQPRLLLMDEPTEGLAPTLVTQIHDLIGQLATGGLTIIITSPQPHLAELAHQVTVLNSGHASPPGTQRTTVPPGTLAAAGAPPIASAQPAPPVVEPAWAELCHHSRPAETTPTTSTGDTHD